MSKEDNFLFVVEKNKLREKKKKKKKSVERIMGTIF